MLLVTGPTGSGKTTTLYACLAGLNRPDVKIITTEDPVEYDIADFVQVAINAKIELDFATSLRAILRHDPDIIMVGEIRDGETAKVAVQSALTGHVVLSTLHTNDAPGAMTRLLDMGMEPFLVTSTVNAVIAQRLVRRLCPSCRAPRRLDEAARAQLGLPAAAPAPASALGGPGESGGESLMQAVGCEACHGLGFQGRLGIFELFVPDDATRELVLERAALSELRRVARERGMRTLRDDGLRKARAGVTTIEEILRETSAHD
jgi:type II secretory ATPase GspE/PulE/Tfp pilus assembly ATPase PilB-like protein